MTTVNFEKAVEILFNEAPSEKARAFVEKIAAQIRAKGDAWIEAHVSDLHITEAELSDQAIVTIEDNRTFYLAQWQLALAQ